jgi:hypothetical protein
MLAAGVAAQAQTLSPYQAATKITSEVRPTWSTLNPGQREALKPLEREWPNIDADRKQKWLAIAAKFPSMSAQERTRIQARMSDWARLSPQERGVARQQFQAAKRAAPENRPSQWEAYQALTADQKQILAARAKPPAASRPDRQAATISGPRAPAPSQAKTNIVPNPAHAAQARPVNAMALQAQPGATTTTINKRPAPPSHQQPGLPKIAASQGFVDKKTLLPRRGPQGAAARSTGTPATLSPE